MAQLYNKETRKPEALDGQDYVNAVVSGTHTFKKGAEVPFFNEEGEPIRIRAEDVKDAVSSGWKPASPSDVAVQQYKENNQGIKGDIKVALGQMADEALTMGLGETILSKTADPLKVAQWQALKEDHGVANVIGGVTGGALSLFNPVTNPLFRGAGAVGSAAEKLAAEKIAALAGREVVGEGVKAAAKNLVTKAASNAAVAGATKAAIRGGAEAAVFSAPFTATEALLADDGERFDTAAESLLSNIAIGSVFGIAAKGLGTAFDKMKQKVDSSLAARDSLETSGMTDLFKEKANEKAVEALNPTLSQLERLDASKDINKLGQFLRDEKIVTTLASKQDIFERLVEKTNTIGKQKSDLIQSLDNKIFAENKADLLIDPTELASKIKTDVNAELGKFDAYKHFLSPFNKQLDEIAASKQIWSLQEAEAQKAALGDVIKTWGLDKTVEKRLSENIYRGINKAVEDKVEQGFGQETLAELKGLKEKYGYLEEAEKIAKKAAAREMKNNDFGLTSYLSAASGATIAGIPGAIVGLAGREVVRRYGDQIASAVYGKASGLLFVEQAMKKTADRLDAIPKMIESMSSGKVKASTAANGAILRFLGEDDKKNVSTENRVEKLAELNDKISSVVANPVETTNRLSAVTSPLSNGGAPKISQEFQMRMSNALNYIQASIPKPPKPNSPFSPKTKWRPSDYDLSRFEQKLQIVQDPMSALDELQAGTLTSSHVEALKAVYPALYQRITQGIMIAAHENPQSMDYSKRLKLSLALGVPLDDSMTANSVRYYQKTFIGPDHSVEQPGEAPGMAKSNVNLAAQAMTPGQARDLKVRV